MKCVKVKETNPFDLLLVTHFHTEIELKTGALKVWNNRVLLRQKQDSFTAFNNRLPTQKRNELGKQHSLLISLQYFFSRTQNRFFCYFQSIYYKN